MSFYEVEKIMFLRINQHFILEVRRYTEEEQWQREAQEECEWNIEQVSLSPTLSQRPPSPLWVLFL